MSGSFRLATLALSVALSVALSLTLAMATDDGSDHPLISRYPESVKSRHEVQDYTSYALITGLNDEKVAPTGTTLEGKLTRLSYSSPRDRSVLEIFRNYEQALERAGAETLFVCKGKECGPAFASSSWGRFNGVSYASGDTKHYLAAKLSSGDVTAYVAVLVNKNRHQIDVLELESMDEGLVTVDADALGDALTREGRVVLGGIFFDFGKATLKAESAPALQEVSKLLASRPDLSLYVVGHTDMVGSLETNMSLSQRRAAAVVKALVEQHGVANERLEPHGVGPLAPRGTNASDGGRERNRRVELVAR